jgi:hypothetical protein
MATAEPPTAIPALGRLYRQAGKAEADAHLAEAVTMYHEMEMSFWLENARAESDL